MSSSVRVNTYTHSVAHVTDNLLSGVKRIILLSGLSLDKLVSDWASLERGIKTWLESKHLESVTLEVYRPSNDSLVTRWDFDIDYTYSTGDDGDLWADTDAIKFAIKKAGEIPSTCTYRIILYTKSGRANVEGLVSCSSLSTEGFQKRAIGTTIGATHIGAAASYWTK